jgi:hypothetical protein
MAEMRRCSRYGHVILFDAPEGTCPACAPRAGPDNRPTSVAEEQESTLGFEPVRPGHVLETLYRSFSSILRVLLSDAGSDATDVADTMPSSNERPAPAERGGRYQVFGEIARDGMGAAHKGRDPDLGRDLAVKVLLAGHEGDPAMMRRFVEEAHIGGQLQHPGIVPMYELGAFANRRPYFTMKLVNGRTPSALLAGRPSPAHDLPRFLSIFEAACQTVSVLALATLGGLSTAYVLQQRQARAVAGRRIIDQVATPQKQALDQPEEIPRWEVAIRGDGDRRSTRRLGGGDHSPSRRVGPRAPWPKPVGLIRPGRALLLVGRWSAAGTLLESSPGPAAHGTGGPAGPPRSVSGLSGFGSANGAASGRKIGGSGG